MDSAGHQLPSNDDVYIGFWIDWLRGRVFGATLTLGKREAGYLSAFLALFVTLAGTNFWRIACFVIHYVLSSKSSKDAIHHQRQAILRNAATATSGLWSVLLLSWAYRRGSPADSVRRTLPLLTVAAATVAGFGAAGIFTSRIGTAMGDAVLLTGRNCGVPKVKDDAHFAATSAYMSQRLMSRWDYALRCYSHNTSLSEGCPTFPRRRLPWRSSADAACPFPGQARVCRRNATNVRLDTGFIDSNADLGINLPPHDSFRYRSVVECAPLKTSGFVRYVTGYSAGRFHTQALYLYGPALAAMPISHHHPNITYVYPAHFTPLKNDKTKRDANRDYTVT
jgi:hypothetical protein